MHTPPTTRTTHAQVHILGVSLGGFLAQVYTQMKPGRVASLVLCNSFLSTELFTEHAIATPMCAWDACLRPRTLDGQAMSLSTVCVFQQCTRFRIARCCSGRVASSLQLVQSSSLSTELLTE